jgi:hypothetical protein
MFHVALFGRQSQYSYVAEGETNSQTETNWFFCSIDFSVESLLRAQIQLWAS